MSTIKVVIKKKGKRGVNCLSADYEAFSPKSLIELKSAVGECLSDADVYCCQGVFHRQLVEKMDWADASDDSEDDDGPPFVVQACKSGEFPLTVEKRKHNRLVTIISNVSGNIPLLLQELKQALGSGGSYDETTEQLEVQGDHTERISTFLLSRGCIKGVTKKLQRKFEARPKIKTTRRWRPIWARRGLLLGHHTTVLQSRPIPKKYVIDSSVPLTVKTVKLMNPTTLKLHLAEHGLSTQGSKKVLCDRLVEFVKNLMDVDVASPDPLVDGVAQMTLGPK